MARGPADQRRTPHLVYQDAFSSREPEEYQPACKPGSVGHRRARARRYV